MARFWKLCLIAGMIGAIAAPAVAADEEEDAPKKSRTEAEVDEDDQDDVDLPGKTAATAESTRPVVEVARGFFVQTDPGSFNYLGLFLIDPSYYPFGVGMYWGQSMRVHVGGDIVTKMFSGSGTERFFLTPSGFGLSAQLTYWQAVNKALYSPDDGLIAQGATRSHLIEASVRPTLMLGSAGRLNVFLRGGAGVGFLQQDREEVPLPGIYSSLRYGIAPHPFVSGGGGIEYYTRLSHFSITLVEVNALYMLGLDIAMGINFAGLKYTF